MKRFRMAVFFYPDARSERARWYACKAQRGNTESERCVAVVDVEAASWIEAQRIAIAAARTGRN